MGFPQIGAVLENGYMVDAACCIGDKRYVLAHQNEAPQTYVVWSVDQDGDTRHGRYFSNAHDAQSAFVISSFDWLKGLVMPRTKRYAVDEDIFEGKTPEELYEMLSKCGDLDNPHKTLIDRTVGEVKDNLKRSVIRYTASSDSIKKAMQSVKKRTD